MLTLIHRSLFFSAVERYGNVVFFVITTAVLSRLLTPHEFGIYALVNSTVLMTTAFYQEFGGGNYLIQKQSLSEDDIRTSFTVTLILSIFFASLLYLSREAVAGFFGEDELKVGLAVSTLNFLLAPFSGTITSLLRRNMSFATIAHCSIAGGAVSSITSIVLAFLKFSFMAPIWGGLAGAVTTTALLFAAQKSLKIFNPSLSGFRDVFSFGIYASGTVIVNSFYSLAPQFILARVINFNAVGLYSRATNVTQVFDRVFLQVFNPVILPAISAHARAGNELKIVYRKSLALISAAHWPFFLFLALLAEPIVAIWLGPTWLEVVPLIRWLSIASMALFAAPLTYPVLVATGNIRDTLITSLISLPPSLLLLFIASFFGVEAVAISALVTLPFQVAVALYFVGRRIDMSFMELISAVSKSALVTLACGGGILAAMGIASAGNIGQVVELFLATAFAAITWWLGLFATRHPLLGQIRLAIAGLAAGALSAGTGTQKTNSETTSADVKAKSSTALKADEYAA